MQQVRSDKELEVSYMTFAQKMLDERKIGYADGLEEGREQGLKKAVEALKGVLTPEVIATQFKMSLDQVMDILGQK